MGNIPNIYINMDEIWWALKELSHTISNTILISMEPWWFFEGLLYT
jgi:hypothetical protein